MLTTGSGNNESGDGSGAPEAQVKIFVRDLQDRQVFTTVFLARDKSMMTGKNGKAYIATLLSDSSGTIDARIWDNVDAFGHLFQSGDVIRVKGQVQIFQGRRQVVVHKVEKAVSDDYKMEDFVTTSTRSPELMMVELLKIAESIENHHIRTLVLETLNDPEIRRKLLRAPAAKSIHHAYLGGLLEHVLSICGIMNLLTAHYAVQKVDLNRDYLIFGAIFHDLGKIWELDFENGITYTDSGKLIGHLVMAVELVEKKASRQLGFPETLKNRLKHIILSHHGKLEYGSPKLPMFLEAFLVAAIDDLDSKMNTIDRFIKSEASAVAIPNADNGTPSEYGSESWSRYNQLFDRYFITKI